MEFSQTYQRKFGSLKQAVGSLRDLLATHLELFDDVVRDGVRNGQIQKFEYCSELLWKAMKLYLREHDGVDAKTPKLVVKEFFLAGYLHEQQYQMVIQMLDDRNILSHLYAESEYDRVLNNLPGYVNQMVEVLFILNPIKGTA